MDAVSDPWLSRGGVLEGGQVLLEPVMPFSSEEESDVELSTHHCQSHQAGVCHPFLSPASLITNID